MKKVIARMLCGVMILSSFIPGTPVHAEEGETVSINISDLEIMGEEAIEESKYSYRVNVSSGSLNVREKPSTSSKIIGTLSKGTIVEVYYIQPKGTPAGWSYVSYPICGYVSDAYLEYVGTP